MNEALAIVDPIQNISNMFGSGSLFQDTTDILSIIQKEIEKAYSFSERTSLQLTEKFKIVLKKSEYFPSLYQKQAFKIILNEISSVLGYNTNDLQIKVSADEELLIIRAGKRGLHYIIVGREENEIFYGFSGKEVGDYSVIQFDEKHFCVSDIVLKFLNL